MNDYWTLTELGTLFGVSSHVVGRTLKEIGLRTPTGQPTNEAISTDLARKFEGPQPWIALWKWDRKRVVPYLEAGGLERADDHVETQ